MLSLRGFAPGWFINFRVYVVMLVMLSSSKTSPQTSGSFSNDDGDGSENVAKAIGLIKKTTTLYMHHAFLYISLRSLHDYEVKMPNFTFYGGRKQATTYCSFSFKT